MEEYIEFRPVVIPKATYDLILKQDSPAGPLALYNFYYYTAVWQKTDKPRTTTEYTAKGLKVSVDKIRKWKKVLLDIGLIEEHQETKGNCFGKSYVKIKYYASQTSLDSRKISRSPGFTECVNPRSARNPETNAYSNNNNKNAYSNNSCLRRRLQKKPRQQFIDLDNPFDIKSAKKMKQIIDSNGKMSKPIKLETWINQIRDLRLKKEIEKIRIKNVIMWYIDHINDKYTPQIYKATDFRDNFKRIEAAMLRTCQDSQSTEPKIILSKQAKKITNQLLELGGWVGDIESQLPQVVQLSLNNYNAFLSKHQKVLNKLKREPNETVLGFMEFLETQGWLDPEYFIQKIWMTDYVWNQIKNWTKWNGKFQNYVFTESNSKLQKIGCQASQDYAQTPDRWYAYFKRIKEA